MLQLVRSLLEQEGLHLHRSCLKPLEMVYGMEEMRRDEQRGGEEDRERGTCRDAIPLLICAGMRVIDTVEIVVLQGGYYITVCVCVVCVSVCGGRAHLCMPTKT